MQQAPPVKVSIRLPHAYCSAGVEPILRIAEKAEELSFFGVSVQDHLVADASVSPCGESHSAQGDDRVVLDSLETLAFVAGRTHAVRLITAVLRLPLHNAILLSKQASTVDVLSQGRLILGIGVGSSPQRRSLHDGGQNLSAHARISQIEFDALGVREGRGALADESLEVMRRIWTEEAPSCQGRFYNFGALPIFPKPLQKDGVPIWVGGRSPAARLRAMRFGDAWIPSQISASQLAESIGWMQGIAAEQGLSMPQTVGVNLFAVMGRTDEHALSIAARSFGGRFAPEGLADSMLVGSSATITDQMRRYVEAGAMVFDLKLLPPTLGSTLEAMETLASLILPALASAA